jgi:1-deoxy-D-xylulose-5-phosphate synthase
MNFPVLDQVNNVKDLRLLKKEQLSILAQDIRDFLINITSKTGGHLGAGLGVVELTIALHYVFNTPQDKLIWDIGHQAYPHKILTGRKDKMPSIRQAGGISGFAKIAESEFDTFGAGHSSTSISAALGIAKARDLSSDDFEVIAVIGDSAMGAGMAFEALNHADSLNSRVIVILNDNDMSIAPAVGGLNKYLTKLISSQEYLSFRSKTKNITKKYTKKIASFLKSLERGTKEMFNNKSNFFEELGFYYIGPVDGHDLEEIIALLENVKSDKTLDGPILIHVVTEKGKGFNSPDCSYEKYHAVSKFDVKTKIQQKSSSVTYTKIFTNSLIEQMRQDDKIIAITAGMPTGTGLSEVAEIFPDRVYDVGIAEQHAVTFAAGFATQGYKPYVAIYSTFLQRAYDQIVHDVAIQKLPVRFIIDRAGYVGNDGPTHAGSYDIAFLSNLPNIVVMAPSDQLELQKMIKFSASLNDLPSSIRYPRGEVHEVCVDDVSEIELGKSRIITKGHDILVINLGTRLSALLSACKILEAKKIFPTIIDARFSNPIDFDLICKYVRTHKAIITIEEGASGGFGAKILEYLTQENYLQNKKIKNLHFPQEIMDQESQENMNIKAGLGVNEITDSIMQILAN